MKWRYQPVYVEDDGNRCITLCECYFADDGRLENWTARDAAYPLGETVEELSQDLARMLADAWKWVPVPFSSLHVGMTFESTGIDIEPLITAINQARVGG